MSLILKNGQVYYDDQLQKLDILIEKNKIYTAADPRGDDYASGK